MAWAWLAVAVKSLPWTAIARRAPEIIDSSARLLATHGASKAAKRAASQTDALRARVETLEAHDEETARVMEEMAAQLQDLTNVVEVLAARVRLLVLLVAAATLAGIVALLVLALG